MQAGAGADAGATRGSPWSELSGDEVRQAMREAHQEGVAREKGVAQVFDNSFSDHQGSDAQLYCGRRPTFQQDVDFYQDDEGDRIYTLGLRSCGSVWACPVCSRRTCLQKGEALQNAIEGWKGGGGYVYLASLTLQHHQGQSLELLTDAVKKAWEYVRNSSDQDDDLATDWKELKTRMGVRGYLRTGEATHGDNGWHPHLHLLIFTARPWTDEIKSAVEDWIFRRWYACLTRIRDRRRDSGELDNVPYDRDPSRLSCTALGEPTRERAVVVNGGERAGWYVAKLGLGREVARIDAKQGRQGNRAPFQILRDLTFYGRLRDRRLWREYVQVMHGRAHWYWSQGFKAELEPQLEADLTEPDSDHDRRVFTLQAGLWTKLRKSLGRGIVGALTGAYRAGGLGAVELLLRRWCRGTSASLEVDSKRREFMDRETVRPRRV